MTIQNICAVLIWRAFLSSCWIWFCMLPPWDCLKTAQSVSMRTPVLIKYQDETILLGYKGLGFFLNTLPSVLSMSLLLIWYNNCSFWVGGRERYGGQCMALSSAVKICSLVKYLIILAFAFWSVPHHLLCSLVPQASLFPKKLKREIQNVISSWKWHIPSSGGTIVSFLKPGRYHSSAAEPQVIHCDVPCLTPNGLNGLLRLTHSGQMLAEWENTR